MANIITLDGIDFTEDCMEIQQIDELEFSLDESAKIVDKSIGSEFTFRRDAFQYIFDKFFSDTDEGCDAIIDVVIILSCCSELTLEYQLTHGSIDYCPETCEMKTILTRLDSDNEAFNFLNRTRLFDGDVLDNIRKPHLHYCTGSFTGLGSLVYNILATILTIINIIPIINIDIPNALKGILGCNKQAPGFVIPDLLEYWAIQAGLTFQSTTIYDLANYNLSTMIAMQFEPPDKDCPSLDIMLENRPNINVIDYIGRLAPLYDSRCRIRNGVLIFETSTWIDDNLVNVGDVANLQFEPLEAICYSYDLDADYAAYGRFEYTYDAVDTNGNRVAPLYNNIVEWNPDGLQSRKGEHHNSIQDFSPLFITGMLPLFVGGVGSQSPEAAFIGFGQITGGQSSGWKIYQWDGASLCESKTIPPPFVPFNSAQWNYPYLFVEKDANGQDGLYETFHQHKAPENKPCPMKTDNFEFVTDDFCAMIETMQTYGTDIYLDSPFGKITPGTVTVDLDKKSFTWSDTRIIKNT